MRFLNAFATGSAFCACVMCIATGDIPRAVWMLVLAIINFFLYLANDDLK